MISIFWKEVNAFFSSLIGYIVVGGFLVILGLVFWGYLWGVAGMVLSVPLLVLTKVILAQFKEARILVRLMGSSNIST